MRPRLAAIAGAMLAALLAGCTQEVPPAPARAAQPELTPQQRRFQRVNRELETGGTVYAYFDVAGDDQKIARMLQNGVRRWAPAAPAVGALAGQDFAAMARSLGLDDITAVGFSSLPRAGGGFDNRAFVYLPGGRHGLWAVFGGAAGRLRHAEMAPADADFYVESDFDLAAAYQVVRDFVAQQQGSAVAANLERPLSKPNVKLGVSVLELIQALKGRMTVFGRIDSDRNYLYYGADKWRAPLTDLLVRVDGLGGLAERILKNSPDLVGLDQAGRHYFRLRNRWPVDGLDFVMVVDGAAFYLATSQAFFEACLRRSDGLDQNPDFAALLAALGPDASAVSYATPHLLTELKRVFDLNLGAPPQARTTMAAVAQELPFLDRPVMAVRQNLPDGILVRARSSSSLKKELLAPMFYGALAATAVPLLVASRQAAATPAGPSFGPGGFGAASRPAFTPQKFAPQALTPAEKGAMKSRVPVLVLPIKPVYPLDLRYRRVESVVLVEFLVTKDGGVERPRALLSSDPAFAAAAVGEWTFQPGIKAGRVVSTHMLVPVDFSLSSQDSAETTTAVSACYSLLKEKWLRRAAELTGRPRAKISDGLFSGLVWARIGVNGQGAVELEQAGHGPTDPGAAELGQVLRQAIADGAISPPMRLFLQKVGYVDIAFPSVANLLWKPVPKAPPSPTPTASPP